MSKIIIALDFYDLNEAAEYVELLKGEVDIFKIGLQLFTRYGPRAVEMVQNAGGEVFLDLKIHDIPSISAKAVKFAAESGCYSTTVHIQSGQETLRETVKARKNGLPHIWGVTVLSSSSSGDSMEPAALAAECGLDGVIVSGDDVRKVKDAYSELECVVPGIRPASYEGTDDQKRILTPAEAARRGADYLVIGRAARNAEDPLKAVKEIKADAGN